MTDTLTDAARWAAAITAGIAARNLATSAWESAVGEQAPTDPSDPDTDWQTALLFTVLTGVFVGVARLLARRGASRMVAGR